MLYRGQEVGMLLNIYTAWGAFFVGIIAGAVSGLRFHSEDFLGGYTSWRRRLVRLAHISLFGIGLINLAFALTARALGISSGLTVASVMLVVGAITMPLVCYLSAFKPAFRHLFFVPVLSVLLGVGVMLWRLISL
jgi:hypothetical protein